MCRSMYGKSAQNIFYHHLPYKHVYVIMLDTHAHTGLLLLRDVTSTSYSN